MYIVLETHGGAEHVSICADENGKTKLFSTDAEALHEATQCQDGKVVNLSQDHIKIVGSSKEGSGGNGTK